MLPATILAHIELLSVHTQVEADVPSMTPPELVRLLVSLVSLAKQGAPLPMQTVNALADAVAKWASQWDLSEAATALSCVLQLAVSSDRAQHRDAAHSVQKSSAQTSAMSRTVVEAVGAGIAKTNRKAGSTATVSSAACAAIGDTCNLCWERLDEAPMSVLRQSCLHMRLP